jgi:hypothetical protein
MKTTDHRIIPVLRASFILAIVAGLVSTGAGQVLLGENVTMGHYVPDTSTLFDGPYNVTVVSGVSDRQLLSPFADRHPGYGVNIDSDRVIIDFVDTVDFTAGPAFHGLIISNLTFVGTASIIETAPHRIFSYDGSTLQLDWQGITVPNGSIYTILLTPAPEPGTFALFGIGLMVAVVYRKRRKENDCAAS